MHIYSKLFPYLRTAQDRNALLAVVKQIRNESFKVGHLSQVEDSEVRRILAELLSQDPSAQTQKLITFLESLPIIRLTLAFEPDEEQLKSLIDELQQEGKEPRLVEIAVDSSLVAGTQLILDGKVIDKSLKTTLHEFFATTEYEAIVKTALSKVSAA